MSLFRRPAVLLLLGLIDQADYARILDAQRRGLRWSATRERRSQAIVKTTLYVLLAVTFVLLVLFVASVAAPQGSW